MFRHSLQSRAEVEKARRKLDGDLRITSEALGDLERSKNEVLACWLLMTPSGQCKSVTVRGMSL